MLAASACESARILLNSKSSKFPQGLANSSGAVGKYLTDSTGTSVSGFIPKLMDGIPHNEDGTGGMHLYMPWWLDNKKLDFPRGYHIELGGGRRMPNAGFGGGIHNFTSVDVAGQPHAFGGYGKQLKNDYRRLYGATVDFAGRGEMIPNDDSYCEIDPTVVDKWGIPVLRFHFKWSDYEIEPGEAHAGDLPRHHPGDGRHADVADAVAEQGYGIAPGGRIIHEVGVTRMGNDPSTSVLNKNCQAHDVKNLFVADGGPFVSQADKNCTWTILALAMRTASYIADAAQGRDRVSLTQIDRTPIAERCCSCSPPPRRRPASPGRTPKRRRRITHAQAAQTGARRPGRRSSRSSSPRTNGRRCGVLVDLIIPKDERSGSATDAGVPEFMDFMMIDQPGRQTAMRGGLAWLDRECVTRFDKTFVACTAAERTRRARRHRLAAEGRAGDVARRRVLQQLPRPHRERVLDEPDGDQGPRLSAATSSCPSGPAVPTRC